MKLTDKITSHIKDPLKSFRSLQIIIAIICMTIPIVLRIFDKDDYYIQKVQLMSSGLMQGFLSTKQIDSLNKIFYTQIASQIKLKHCDSTIQIDGLAKICKDGWGFRLSVSDYAYSSKSYLFGMLYCMAAMLYIYNGLVYLKQRNTLNVQKKGHWYNVIIGLCLIGVILNPQSNHAFLHNLFSILFFIGNVCVMLFFPKEHETAAFKVTRIAMALITIVALLGALVLCLYTILWAEWISLTIIASYLIMVATSTKKLNI